MNGLPSAYWPFTVTLKLSPPLLATSMLPASSPLPGMWPAKLHCPARDSALGMDFCQSLQALASSG
ncbi:hypothetical protein D3C81_2228260 [compost metagenome]